MPINLKARRTKVNRIIAAAVLTSIAISAADAQSLDQYGTYSLASTLVVDTRHRERESVVLEGALGPDVHARSLRTSRAMLPGLGIRAACRFGAAGIRVSGVARR